MTHADFFRSMSLAEDLDHAERFSHYHPTSRALPIVDAVLAPGGASMIMAPYGSGKSLAAGVGALFVANRPGDRTRLRAIAERIGRVDPVRAERMDDRLAGDRRGAIVALVGHVPDPIAAIAAALGIEDGPSTVDALGRRIAALEADHVAIVWDEFGRHLEALASDGRSAELDVLQRLAERASRAAAPSMSLTLLLHQNLLSYGTRLNETSRTEWRKIEGRFAALRMVEDSQEFYELVGEAVQELGGGDTAAYDEDLARRIASLGWYDGMADPARLLRLIRSAAPLSPGALQVLPTLVSRVGQNERSLFAFLRESDLSKSVGMEEVFSSFGEAMRADVGIGGSYRRWIETESARSRADTPLKRELLAAACLLQLGGAGERRRVPRQAVELAVSPHAGTGKTIAKAFDELVESKLMLWRRHNDDAAVWHGADIDVSLRVREERERRRDTFDLKTFLEERFPAPHLRAPGHNVRLGVNRHLVGRYVTPAELRGMPEVAADVGGEVAFVLASTASEIADALRYAEADARARTVVVVPQRPVEIESAALELVAIEALRSDREFMSSDPMVGVEIDEIQSVAFEQLARQMRALLDPAGPSATWLSGGRRLDVSYERPASVSASRLLDAWFPKTPRIANEQLMRPEASRTMQTARVRVVTAILERSDRPDLGYDPADGGADASIYRTVLAKTGLRRASDRYAGAGELDDPALAEIWDKIAAFFSRTDGDATETSRPLALLVDELAGHPYGLPRAVMPVIIAAGYRTFARAAALYKGTDYLGDVLGFQFDAMVSNPADHSVRILRTDPEVVSYLSDVCYAFEHERPGPNDELVRAAWQAVRQWLSAVPDGVRRSNRLNARERALLRAASADDDAVRVLMADLPNAMGADMFSTDIAKRLGQTRMQIDGLGAHHVSEAIRAVRDGFAGYDGGGTLAGMRVWAECFSIDALDRAQALRIVDRAVVRKALEIPDGQFSERSLANSLSSILLQRSLDKWDDRTAPQFRAALRETRDRIEAAALDTSEPIEALRPIIENRLRSLQNMLAKLDGEAERRPARATGARD